MDSKQIARLLPGVVQRTLPPDLNAANSPLAALLTLMTALHQNPEDVLSQLERYLDAATAPEDWVYYLASWFDLEPLFVESSLRSEYVFSAGMGRLRELILAAVSLVNERGTYRGLRRFLQIAIGHEAFNVTEDAALPFHIRVHYPRAAASHLALIRRIVELEKPAYVTYELVATDDLEPDRTSELHSTRPA